MAVARRKEERMRSTEENVFLKNFEVKSMVWRLA